MLCNKDGMAAHRCLLTIVFRPFWRNAVKQKLFCMLKDNRKCFLLKIALFVDTQTKSGAKW